MARHVTRGIFAATVCMLLPGIAMAFQSPSIPEPDMSSLLLAGGALALVAYLRRRK